MSEQQVTALDLDPVDVFAKLVREVDAGTALVTMSLDAGERRRAALDALTLARCVLEDARELLDQPPVVPLRFPTAVAITRCDVTHSGPRCPEDHTP